MLWWHWVLIVMVFFTLLFIMLVWFGFAIFVRFTQIDPTLEALFLTDSGKVRSRELLKNVGLFSSEWKMKSSHPSKVKFKLRPKGIGKSREMEELDSNVLELEFYGQDKKVVIFNKKALDNVFKKKLTVTQRLLDDALEKQNYWEFHYRELYSNFNKKIQETKETYERLIKYGAMAKYKKPTGST